jgi:hypothetical protein
MSENLSSAACTEQEYQLAREAGLLVVTTDDERAIHKFAEAVRALAAPAPQAAAAEEKRPMTIWEALADMENDSYEIDGQGD